LRGNGLEYLSTAATALLLGLSGAMAILIGLMLLRARLRGAKKTPETS
jgi:hypothetical protein